MPERHYVGGFVEVTTLTKERVVSRVIHRWDDRLGEVARGAYADKAARHAGRLVAVERRMLEKKQRKGTLRAAA